MANMLRGKFRDKLRKYILNRNKKSSKESIKDTKETIENKKDVTLIENDTYTLKENNEQKKISVNNQSNVKKITSRINKQYLTNFSNKKSKPYIKKGASSNKKSENKKIEISKKSKLFEIEQLENTIINKINDRIISYKNELEIIQSDIYVLSKLLDDKKDRENCEEERKNIEEIIRKLQKIKEQYEILKSKNINFEYLGITDNLLVDDIYNYKKILDSVSSVNNLQEKYEKLELFFEVSIIVDNVQNEINRLEEENKKKLDKLDIEENEFEKLKNEMFNIDKENTEYDKFIDNSNKILEELSGKIDFIDSKEEITYKLSGMNGLLFNNLKYISLLMLSPLKGIFPSIATSIIATKKTLDTIKDNIEVEEINNIIYMAKDYDEFISDKIYSVDNMKELVTTSLDDVKKIKENLKAKYSYLDSIELKEVLNKIDKVEENLKNNMEKLKIIDNKLNGYKEINNNKMKKIKR